MKISLVQGPLSRPKPDGWIVFVYEGEPLGIRHSTAAPIMKLKLMIRDWMKSTGFTGKQGEINVFPSWDALPARFVIVAGLGSRREFHGGRILKAAATAGRTARRLKMSSVSCILPSVPDKFSTPSEHFARQAILGFSRGCYKFDRFMSGRRAHPGPSALDLFATSGPTPALRKAVKDTALLQSILSEVRDVANLPANEAPPAAIASQALALARRHGVKCTVLDKKALAKKKCNALLAVARGSRQDARLIILKYPGTRKNLKPLVLVGKTITFDTGGISIKPSKGMEWMKYDKSGGMAVLAAVLLAARMRLHHPVIAVLAAAENMPGGDATRPGDIIRAASGKSIEILNTDAEGRLVLADALTVAGEFQPEAIVDLATLTGACVVALGHVLAAVMGTSHNLIDELLGAGQKSGERLWPLPLLADYDDDLSSPFADLKNIGENGAGAIIGGTFLKNFVSRTTPWAHIDIAGTAYEEHDRSHMQAGATLFGAMLLLDWMTARETKNVK